MYFRMVSIGLLLALSNTIVHARSGDYAATCQDANIITFADVGTVLNAVCAGGGDPYTMITVGSLALSFPSPPTTAPC